MSYLGMNPFFFIIYHKVEFGIQMVEAMEELIRACMYLISTDEMNHNANVGNVDEPKWFVEPS